MYDIFLWKLLVLLLFSGDNCILHSATLSAEIYLIIFDHIWIYLIILDYIWFYLMDDQHTHINTEVPSMKTNKNFCWLIKLVLRFQLYGWIRREVFYQQKNTGLWIQLECTAKSHNSELRKTLMLGHMIKQTLLKDLIECLCSSVGGGGVSKGSEKTILLFLKVLFLKSSFLEGM